LSKYRKIVILKNVNAGYYKALQKIYLLNFRDLVIVSTLFSIENQLFHLYLTISGAESCKMG